MADNVHIGDVGTIFRLTIKDQDGTVVDISSATTQEIIFQKPDGTSFTKTSVFTSDGTNGQTKYISVDGDLNVKGLWHIQAHVIISAGEWHSSIKHFKVKPNI